MIHEIFQRTGRLPHEVYNAPDGSKRFMYASMALVLEEEAEARKRQQREEHFKHVRRRKGERR